MTIHHRPGRVHGNSDALSRRPCERVSGEPCCQCPKATSTLLATPISCDALSTDGSPIWPTPLRFPSRYSQPAGSPDLVHPSVHADIAPDLLELPALPVSSGDAVHASPSNDVTARTNVFNVTAEPSSLTLEDIQADQAADDNFLPVIQALADGVKPPRKVCTTFRKKLAFSSSNGIHSSSRTASCTGGITILTVLPSTCSLCYRPN